MLRIQDVIVTKDPTKPPTQDNIKKVVEIKLPNDDWGPEQEEDYLIIAGSSKKLKKLTPDECGCGSNVIKC